MEDGATVNNDGKIPGNVIAGETPSDASDFISTIPEAYREKPFMKGIDSLEGLLKQHENAQSLIGKKQFGVPEETAGDDAWNEFYNKIRPESADKYEFTEVEFPEGFERNDEIAGKVKELFHQAGLSTRQAKAIQEGYDKMMAEAYKADGEAYRQKQEQLDAQFEEAFQKDFGKDHEQVFKDLQESLSDAIPDQYKSAIENMSNDQLLVMAHFANKMKQEYMDEDGGGMHPQNEGGTAVDLRAERMNLLKKHSEVYAKNPMSSELRGLEDQIRKINDRMRRS